MNESKINEEMCQYLQDISSFYDPLSLDIMVEPVLINGEGTSYDAASLKLWVESCLESRRTVTSPLTGLPFCYPNDVSPNLALKSAITEVSTKVRALAGSGNLEVANENIAFRAIVSRLEGCVKGLSSDIFDDLDALQEMDLMKTLNLKAPQIIVIGDEKDGKSTLLERVVGFPIFPKRKQLSTLCIIRVHLRRRETALSKISVVHRKTGKLDAKYGVKEIPLQSMSETLQLLMDEMETESRSVHKYMPNRKSIISDKEIVVSIQVPYCPNLDVLDLPGLVANPSDAHETTTNLASSVLQNEAGHSIFLLVLKAVNNPSQSLAASLIAKYKLFHKTLGVLTHLDRFQSDDDDETAEQALYHLMSPRNQNFFDLGQPWLGCASKMPPNAQEMTPMHRLLQTERLEQAILEEKFSGFLLEEEPRLGLPVIRAKVTAEFEKFICRHWVADIVSYLSEYFWTLSDSNANLGLPMPYLQQYEEPFQKLTVVFRNFTTPFDFSSMYFFDTQDLKDIIATRSHFVCRNSGWLKLSEAPFWYDKEQLERIKLPSGFIDFDKSFSVIEKTEKEVIKYLKGIVKGIVKHGGKVSSLYIQAVLLESQSNTVYQQNKSGAQYFTGENLKFSFFSFSPDEQVSVLKAKRFDGLLESYKKFIDEAVQAINSAFEIQAYKLIDGVKGELFDISYILEEENIKRRVKVKLDWKMDIRKFGNSLLTKWLGQLLMQMPKLTTWDFPTTCITENVCSKRVELFEKMICAAQTWVALFSLGRKYS